MAEQTDSGFLLDRYKLDLSKDDFFDRIINLKITTADASEYVIRSDYEMSYIGQSITTVMQKGSNPSNSCVIRKCQYKPSIKVQYKQVNAGTRVEIDIFVSNFYALDNKGNILLSFNNRDNPITSIKIAMGYWGQFKNLKPDTVDDYFSFDYLDGKAYGISALSCTVAYAQTDSLAPDAVLHIHGYVGNSLSSAVNDKSLTTYSDAVSGEFAIKLDSSSSMKDFMFNVITKRYLRYPADESLIKQDKNGLLTDTYAEDNGVIVYCSKGAEELFSARAAKYKDSDGKEQSKTVTITNGFNVVNAMYQLLSGMSNEFRFKQLNNGNIMVFISDEYLNPATLTEQFDILPASGMATYFGHDLPAIYNMTVEALCTITCPFFAFIEPFEYVRFNNRYALGNLVTYYASFDTDGNARYYVIGYTVSFATTENVNEMSLMTVSNKDI